VCLSLYMVPVPALFNAGSSITGRTTPGELTLFQAVAQYSIAPGAKQNLGESGWVVQGRAQPALDELIFMPEHGEPGGTPD